MIYIVSVLYAFTHMTSSIYLTHLSLHQLTYVCYIHWCLCIVPFTCLTSPVCTWASFRPPLRYSPPFTCLTGMPDPPSTPFPYHMHAAHLLSSVHVLSLSLSPTRFCSQLYISHNIRIQVENKTTFIILISVTLFGALICAEPHTTTGVVGIRIADRD